MKRLLSSIAAVLLAIGCAQQPSSTTKPTARLTTTQPSGPPEAFLALDELPDRPDLAQLASTQPDGAEPSLEAVELYARARGAMIDGQAFNAINLLERAIQADPNSFDLRYDLGKAYTALGSKNQQSLAAYEAAAKIKPGNIAVQTELGRKYLANDKPDDALVHLRLAVQTEDYQSDEDAAGLADYYLARALQRKGYDRAAIDQYDSLLKRLQRNTLAMRGNPELAYIATHPESLYLNVGQLYEKHHQYDLALRAYQIVLERNPESFDNQARVVNTLVLLGRDDEAIRKSIELVSASRASGESLKLLKDVYKKIGKEQAVIDELKKLQAARPNDRVMLYALADTLYDFNRRDEAAALLTDALKRDPKSLDIFRKLFTLYESRDETTAAAKVWINYLTDHPDALTELAPLWDKLTRVYRRNSIRLTKLQQIEVPERSEGCKLYLVSRQALAWNRVVLAARNAVEQATRHRPIFPPAFRAQMNDIWNRQEWDAARKKAESDALVTTVNQTGEAAFAAELRGMALLNEGNIKDSIDAFAEATKLGNQSPDLQLTYALAMRQQGNEQKFEQLMWKLISDRPGYEQGYTALFNHYDLKKSEPQKRKVLKTWLDAEPGNVRARLLETDLMLTAGPAARGPTLEAIEARLLDIFRDNPDEPVAIAKLAFFYEQTGRVGEITSRLENERQKNPTNRVAVQSLVELYVGQKRPADAIRVLDDVRGAIGDDPDLLYSLASMYQLVDQPQTTEEILAKVILISPQHAAANNDLGYTWADRGSNLDRAESMIRIAVDAEPDNESFLDSLGWVLYKRARFDEARGFFERAIAPVTFPDPVVVDHLGDTLYQLNEPKLAKQRWDEAIAGISKASERGTMRDELMKLRLTLIGKIKQVEQNKPVIVAPTAGQASAVREQAKN